MIITLDNTTSARISSTLVKARRTAGSPAMGMVLTLIIVADEKEYADALQSSMEAGREHPSRILLVVTNSSRKPTLNAEVRIGEGTPGEVIVVRMSGAIAEHPASVIRPLLLPDSPVVIWWPGKCPANPATDELAQLAGRRMTDAANTSRSLHALAVRAENYLPGDTDLAWTRLTPWRALLAAALDQYPARITSATVEAERSNPSADLLAAWLHQKLKLDVNRKNSSGPGLTAVRLGTAAGDIAITRPDGLLASYAVPGQPERLVALKRREITELISEEMRRMDSDEVYGRVLSSLQRMQSSAAKEARPRKRTTTQASKIGVDAEATASEPGTEVAVEAPVKKAARKQSAAKAATTKAAESETASADGATAKKSGSRKSAAKQPATRKTTAAATNTPAKRAAPSAKKTTSRTRP